MLTKTTIRKQALARLAGVTAGAVGAACRGILQPALTPDGRQLFREHPAVVDYISRKHVTPAELRARNGAKSAVSRPQATSTGVDAPKSADPFALAAASAKIPSAGVSPAVESGAGASPSGASPPALVPVGDDQRARQFLYDLHFRTNGVLPENLDELGAMTLREVADNFGSLQELHGVVKSLKDYAIMQATELKTQTLRGELLPRDLAARVFLPLVDMMTTRLVSEVPPALAHQIIARVLSGGDDLLVDVTTMIRKENSSVCKTSRDAYVKELKNHAYATERDSLNAR